MDVVVDIRQHGIALDPMNKKVQCNYCAKIVSGFYRLKCHLGAVGTDVVSCLQVPSTVMKAFETMLMSKKIGTMNREVGQLHHPNLSLKRSRSSGPHSSGVPKEDKIVERKSVKKVQPNRNIKSAAASVEDSYSQKCIARFFYETGTNFSAAEASSFKRMVEAIRKSGDGGECSSLIPSYQQLRGTIFEDEVKEMEHYVQQVKSSWSETGCSILLDGWTDGNGHNLINIVVDCPKGPVYLRSLNISSALENAEELMKMLDQVIEDVGVSNVVQVVTYCTSRCMETVGRQIMEKYKNLFWVVGASHCLELMLEGMSSMDLLRVVMEKAKTITKFIYSCAPLLNLMRSFAESFDLITPSKMKSAIPFLTLENIVMEKENLQRMFSSSEWGSSIWASSLEGKKVADLVLADHLFWNEVTMVVKATIPIVSVMSLIHKADKPLLGFIYETIDQAKETIKEELKMKKAHYMPFWDIIDDVWNNKLHSPIHSAGYFLNPSFIYSSDFFADPEIASGLLCYIVRTTKAKHVQDLVSVQVDEYREANGSFGEGSSLSLRQSISPDIWWTRYGGQYPELQRLAIRALSQTCDDATKYHLQRSLAEKLLITTGRRNDIEQQHLMDLAFVHYNMQLQNFDPKVSMTGTEEIDPMSDWIVSNNDENMAVGRNLSFSWVESEYEDGMTTTAADATMEEANMKEEAK